MDDGVPKALHQRPKSSLVNQQIFKSWSNDGRSTNDDKLFGVNTSSRLKNELKKESYNSNVNNNPNFIRVGNTIEEDDNKDFEIVFEEREVTLDKQGNGNAITEHYESPIIKRNKK